MNQKQMMEGRSAFRTTEEFHAYQQEFLNYITDEVNPARINAGLPAIGRHEAHECFRILDKFFVHWRSNARID